MEMTKKEKFFLAEMLEAKKANSKRALARFEIKMQNPPYTRKDYEPLIAKHKEIIALCDGLIFGMYGAQQKAE